MAYQSIDELQNFLTDTVFSDRKDTKKASGRALGTLLELITYYIFHEWGLTNNTIIELKIPEFGNPSITHNVEFSLHPLLHKLDVSIDDDVPFTSAKLIRKNPKIEHLIRKFPDKNSQSILTKDNVQRNNTILRTSEDAKLMLNFDNGQAVVCQLDANPFAMIECKRVGVEEGNKKGPTTIEKAKQGAYVAKTVSALQKIRTRSGEILGFYENNDGTYSYHNYKSELQRLIYDASTAEMNGFVLSVGVVSNHGNWFSEDVLNKELLVLKDSYDWLLFLEDNSMVEFVTDTIVSPKLELYQQIRKAFIDSYDKGIKGNKLTKVNLYKEAHVALCHYFKHNIDRIERNWFNVITPRSSNCNNLKDELLFLQKKLNKC